MNKTVKYCIISLVENNRKKVLKMNKKITLGIVIGVLLIATIGFTYSFFSTSITGEGEENIVTAGTLQLVYKDGDEVILNNAYPGDSITKTFTVSNTGTLTVDYSIKLSELINTITNDELVVNAVCKSYTEYETNKKLSEVCSNIDETIITNSSASGAQTIKENISIKPGITHEYTITFTFKEMNTEQNYNQGKTFSTKAQINESTPSNRLVDRMLRDSVVAADNVASEYVTASTGINFGARSSDTNGKGLYYTTNTNLTEDLNGDGKGERVYYYRGAVENNNVRFGGYCWRIVRTNEDGSVRLRYNGEYSNGTCPVTGTEVKINNTNYQFYEEYDDQKYNEYIWEDGTGESLAKTTIDAWYTSSGLEDYEDQIANVPYCADKSNPTTGYNNYSYYGAANRLTDITYTNSTYAPKGEVNPTYKCADIEDKHTVAGDSWGGNGKLSKPIGLLTADEVAYAGGGYYQSDGSSNNITYYLYTSAYYWLISPFFWTGSVASSFRVDSTGSLGGSNVNYTRGLVPAVSLKAGTMVNAQGDGTYTNPYVVES